MIGEYPIYINGEKTGSLTVSKNGIKYLFSATCNNTGELTRLSVYGGGNEGYLGVLTPQGDFMYMDREFSRNDLSNFPDEIEFASNSGKSVVITEKPKPKDNDIVWHRDSVGLLWTKISGIPHCAVPKRLGIACQGVELGSRVIEGIEYRIFRFKISKKINHYEGFFER